MINKDHLKGFAVGIMVFYLVLTVKDIIISLALIFNK